MERGERGGGREIFAGGAGLSLGLFGRAGRTMPIMMLLAGVRRLRADDGSLVIDVCIVGSAVHYGFHFSLAQWTTPIDCFVKV